ncbi:MAG: putative hydroxymethylpyrimidine transporter CytX, partial [Methanobacteriota archaeon]
APTVLNVLQLLGWAAFELLVMGYAAAVITGYVFGPWTAAIFVPIFGAIVAALALGGPLVVVRQWLEKFAIWLVYASTAAIAVAIAIRGVDLAARPMPSAFAGPASYLLALDLVIVMPISWWPLVSDYNRFARRARDSALGTTSGYTIANTAFYVLGAALLVFGPDVVTAIALLGLGLAPLLFILVDETDNAFANVYSTAVSLQNLVPRARQAWPIVAATGIAIAGAWLLLPGGNPFGGAYETFLLLVGGLFVPLLGVVIADSFLVRRGAYAAEEFFASAPAIRWPAFASWIPGIVLYFVVVLQWIPGFPPVGATLPSFALAAGLHVVFAKVAASRALHGPAAPGARNG